MRTNDIPSELEASFNVCPHCGHHMRLPARKRLEMLFDRGEYQTLNLPSLKTDLLNFRDKKKYAERLKDRAIDPVNRTR